MKVETYEIEEITNEAGLMAADSEAIELINKLELNGQRELCNENTATRFQYPKLTKVQDFVFRTCFPRRTAIKNFNSGIIPLRVLQVAAFCKDFPQAAHLEIWHTEDQKKDPILVGRSGQYSGDFYLLARWGDALETFEQLQEKAKAIWKAETKSKLAKWVTQIKSIVETLDEESEKAALTGDPVTPTFYY